MNLLFPSNCNNLNLSRPFLSAHLYSGLEAGGVSIDLIKKGMAPTLSAARQRASTILDAFVRSYPLRLNDRFSIPLRARPVSSQSCVCSHFLWTHANEQPNPSCVSTLQFFVLSTLLFVAILAVLALAPIPEIPINDKVSRACCFISSQSSSTDFPFPPSSQVLHFFGVRRPPPRLSGRLLLSSSP